jgi:transcription factor C subunit 6
MDPLETTPPLDIKLTSLQTLSLGCGQYLAVSPMISRKYSPRIGGRDPSPACIQIWSIRPSDSQDDDAGTARCELVLCIDVGAAHDLKWCPLPSHDEV